MGGGLFGQGEVVEGAARGPGGCLQGRGWAKHRT